MSTNDRWIARNFSTLIDQYGGRYVAIVNKKVVAVGDRPERVEAEAEKKTGAKTPSVVMVPAKGSFGFTPLRLFGLS
jgi:hypothetical protein